MNDTLSCDFEWLYADSQQGDAILIPIFDKTILEFKLKLVKQFHDGHHVTVSECSIILEGLDNAADLKLDAPQHNVWYDPAIHHDFKCSGEKTELI